MGYEVDCVHWHALANLEILARSPWIKLDDSGAQGWAHMTIHTVLSGALVFATGSIQWSWGLDDYNEHAIESGGTADYAQCTAAVCE